MLWVVVSSLCLWLAGVANGQKSSCPLLHTAAPVQSGTNNYVIDLFFGLSFPFAINQCTSVSFISENLVMYSCSYSNNTWWVTKTSYSTSSCSGSGKVESIWKEGEYSFGEPGHFVCDGSDSYVEVKIALDTCGSGLQTVFGGLSGCAMNSPRNIQFYCDSSNAYVQLFENTTYLNTSATQTPYGYCDPSLYCDKWTFSSSCGLVANVLGNPLYGSVVTCGVSATTTTQSTTKKSAHVQFAPFFSVILVLIVSTVWFH